VDIVELAEELVQFVGGHVFADLKVDELL